MLKSLDLSGKVAVVIGGTSGIGKTMSVGLAEAGADVVPCSRRIDAADPVATEIESHGRRSLRLAADVADRESLTAAREEILAKLGRVDILINCAGRIKRTPILDMPEEEWSAIIDTNLTGTLRACQVFAPPMLQQGWGRIVNIASLNSFVALLEVGAYAASKAGVAGLTKALAVEWGSRGVNVNAIAPGVFRTPLNQQLLDGTDRGRELKMRTPLKRFGTVDELIGAAVLLSSDAASFINGEVLVVDGGFLASGVNQ
ncbi:MAG TPA: SDR family oxidoreductase [Bryobacteraceae bacterium]|jgi:NAD(P)-dependent dehydrogenase (short-subunit alcohol dehydrogenase family)